MDARILALSVFVVFLGSTPVVFGVANDSKECVTIDAALNWGENLYFFSGDQYVKVDKGRREVHRKNIDDWHEDLPRDLDAAITWTPVTDYFFKGQETYKMCVMGNISRVDSQQVVCASEYWAVASELEGPWNSATEWTDFFKDGIDAAAHREDTDKDEYGAFFFKGCEYIVYWGWYDGYSVPKRVPEGLPCDIDAAWELQVDDDVLVALKGDKIYHWGDELDGPKSFSDYYSLTTWKLCP